MNAPLSLRPDLALIAAQVPAGSRVLDVGCGDGQLLAWLAANRQCDARGIEISREGVSAAVARGLSVIQGDADTDLADYPDACFDVVILSQTIQATRQPAVVLRHLARIGQTAIVSFPNFGYWRARLQFLLTGRMPVTPALPATWYDTPNIHLCTIADFEALARVEGLTVRRAEFLRHGQQMATRRFANLLGETGLYVLQSNG